MSPFSPDTLRQQLDSRPLEEVILSVSQHRQALAEADPDGLSELERELVSRARSHRTWQDSKAASAALRSCLELAREHDLVDGDTPTLLLARALEQRPGDEALLLEYLQEIYDTDYRYTGLTLGGISQAVADPALRRRLALAESFAEYFVLRAWLGLAEEGPYGAAMRQAFGQAAAAGATEPDWLEMRGWLKQAMPRASVPEDLYRRFSN